MNVGFTAKGLPELDHAAEGRRGKKGVRRMMSTKNITFPSDTVCITCFGRSGEGRRRKGLLRSVSKALGCAVVALEYAFKADARRVFGGECRGQQFGVHLNSRSKGQRRQPVRAAGGTHHFGADWRQNTKGFGADWRHNTKTSVELICFLPLDILPAYEHTTRAQHREHCGRREAERGTPTLSTTSAPFPRPTSSPSSRPTPKLSPSGHNFRLLSRHKP